MTVWFTYCFIIWYPYPLPCVADALNLQYRASGTVQNGLDECVGRLQRRLPDLLSTKFNIFYLGTSWINKYYSTVFISITQLHEVYSLKWLNADILNEASRASSQFGDVVRSQVRAARVGLSRDSLCSPLEMEILLVGHLCVRVKA